MKRKLTTIFCADVFSYTTLMAHNERETLERLKRYRGIMEELFLSHDGRKVNTWGDAVIAEFNSVVEAVRCSVEIQDAINAENIDLPNSEKMHFRIGINLGDVMDDNGDLYGDGVNRASRLESLAEPGGIMVSKSVHDFTRKQLSLEYDFAGERRVKDSDEPILCYRIHIGGSNRGPTSDPDVSSDAPEDDIPDNFPGQYADESYAFADANYPQQERSWISSIGAKISNTIENFQHWFPRQSKKVKFYTMMIGFFFMINLLFTGIASPWFIFPSAPFIFLILMSKRKN